MGRGDIVTPEQREAWFALPYVKFVMKLWLAGLAIGLPLLIITWLYEYTRWSRFLKFAKNLIAISAFLGGLWTFIKVVVLPKF